MTQEHIAQMKRYDFYGTNFDNEEHATGDWVKYEDAQAAIQAAVLAEREACAKLAEPLRVAEAIRARGKS